MAVILGGTMTDRELLDQYLTQGKRDALGLLVSRHIDMVYATARQQVRDATLADDITQAVFLVLLRKARQLSPRVVLSSWLFQATLYAAAESRRAGNRRQKHEQEAAAMTARTPASQAEFDPILRARLNDAIGRLSNVDRTLIVQRYLEGRTTGQIAQSAGISEHLTRSRLSRAMDRLRKKYLRRSAPLAVAAIAILLETRPAAAAPPLVQLIQAVVQGSAKPSPGSVTLAKGVIRMFHHTRLVAGMALALAAATSLFFALPAALSQSAPATPSTAPAVIIHYTTGPADGARQVLDNARRSMGTLLPPDRPQPDLASLTTEGPAGSYRLGSPSWNDALFLGYTYLIESGGKQIAAGDARIETTGQTRATSVSSGGQQAGATGIQDAVKSLLALGKLPPGSYEARYFVMPTGNNPFDALWLKADAAGAADYVYAYDLVTPPGIKRGEVYSADDFMKIVRPILEKMGPTPQIKRSLKVGEAPAAAGQPRTLAHPRQAATAALDLVTATRADTGFVTSTIHRGLFTSLMALDSAAQALLQTQAANPEAAPQTLALATALDQTITMAEGIANRASESAATREKSASLAAKLEELANQ